MLAIWLFTFAGIIAGFGILFAYKRLMRGISYRIKREEFDYKGLQKDQIRFFIQVGLTEAIPIFLIVLGFMFMEQGSITTSSLIIPLILILGVIGYSIIQIRLTNNWVKEEAVKLEGHDKGYVTTLSMMGYMLVLGLPVLAIIAMFLMV